MNISVILQVVMDMFVSAFQGISTVHVEHTFPAYHYPSVLSVFL